MNRGFFGFAPVLNTLTFPRPVAILQSTVDQSVPNATGTPVVFDKTVWDPYGMRSNAVGSLQVLAVPQGARWVEVGGMLDWAANDVGVRNSNLYILRGGDNYLPQKTSEDRAANLRTSTLYSSGPVPVLPRDQFYIDVYQTSGGALALQAGSYLWMEVLE